MQIFWVVVGGGEFVLGGGGWRIYFDIDEWWRVYFGWWSVVVGLFWVVGSLF